VILVLLACAGSPSSDDPVGSDPVGSDPVGSDPVGDAPVGDGPAAPIENLDQGQQHPPLPADNPAWEWDAGGFVGDFGWYGEHSWADVRMRVAGHLSTAGRDAARLEAQQGNLAAAAERYRQLAGILAGIPTPSEGIAEEIVVLLREAAQRDAALLEALATGAPLPTGEGLAGLRATYLDLARRHIAGEDVSAEALALQEALKPYLEPRPDLDLDAFTDFNARHALRVRLFAAYLDSLDPIGISERWGYWEADEIVRQALLIGAAAGELGGKPWAALAGDVLVGAIPPQSDPIRRPSVLADALVSRDQVPGFTAEGLGWLPTGDSLIDLGGEPGPRAIGTLQKMGLEDPEHRAWLEATAARLDALREDPEALVAAGREAVSWLDGHTHGSRFYNVKQARNELVRQLAREGRFALAAAVLSDNLPLHNQDWACPNRAGILSAIEGRLLAEAGDPRAAAVLERALEEGQDFLSEVDRAEAQPGHGLKPPGMGDRGKAGAPGANGPPGPPPGGSQGGRQGESPAGGRPPGHPPGHPPGSSGSGPPQPGHR
jgi:hypothetical protein